MEIGQQIFQKMKSEIVLNSSYKMAFYLKYKSLICTILTLLLIFISSIFLFSINYNRFIIIVGFLAILTLGGMGINKINEILTKKLQSKINAIPDNQVLNLLMPSDLKKMNIKTGDSIHYINGFKFSESCLIFKIEKLSKDGDYLLLKDDIGKYQEVSIKDFLRDDFQIY